MGGKSEPAKFSVPDHCLVGHSESAEIIAQHEIAYVTR